MSAAGRKVAPMACRPNDAESILGAAIDLQPRIRAERERIENERRLPEELVVALKEAGVFRMTMPRDWGGAELDPLNQLRVIETLSLADASVGWCVMIGSDSGYFSGFIDQRVARIMYPDIDMITGAALTATGRAVREKNGYHVSGRFPFSSGCHHASWFVLGCKVYDGDQQQFLPDGTPKTLQCFVSADDVGILDTWYSTGLCGSGSNDLSVEGCFVPVERTFSFQDIRPYRESALYSFPLNMLLNFSSVPLGAAQCALDAVIAAGERPSRITAIGGKVTPLRSLRDEAFVQDAVGRAAAMIGSARAYLYDTIGDVWQALQSGRDLSSAQLAGFQLVNTHVYETCTEAVQLLYKVRGGSSVYTGNELDRCLRDCLTMNQHVMNSLRSYAMGGRLLLGLPPEFILL
ncbi:MAG TPA: acyl-CoA dehydrogenase family protein [Gammaproteobacteria bacterium]